MSANFEHLRIHMSLIRAEFERGTSPTAALKTLRLIFERQKMADRLNLEISDADDESEIHANVELQT